MEAKIQHECVMWFNKTYRKVATCAHVRNSFKQSSRQGAVWRGLGVLEGFPDLIIIQGHRVLLVELKDEGGRLSKAQRAFHEQIAAQGGKVWVLRSLSEFQQVVSEFLAGG